MHSPGMPEYERGGEDCSGDEGDGQGTRESAASGQQCGRDGRIAVRKFQIHVRQDPRSLKRWSAGRAAASELGSLAF